MNTSRKPAPRGRVSFLLAAISAASLLLFLCGVFLAQPGDHSGFGFVFLFFLVLWPALSLMVWLGAWMWLEWVRRRRLGESAPSYLVTSIVASSVVAAIVFYAARVVVPP